MEDTLKVVVVGEDVCGQVGLLILRNWVTLSRTLIPGDTASSLPSGG